MMKPALSAVSTMAVLMVVGCGAPPKSEEKVEKRAPEPIGGQKAFFRMYGQAHAWAQDVQAFQLEPVPLKAVPEHDGLWPAWRASFVSESKRAMKTFSFSVIKAEGIHEGIFSGPQESWSGARGQNMPFPIAGFKIDSPAAMETAKKESASYRKKFPDMPITMVLERTKELPNPAWRVIWGTSAQTSSYSVYIDAVTGARMKARY